MSIDSRISRIYLALLTAIDQFCFHSYMVRDDPRYAQDEEALKKDRILEEYVESVKSLSIAIRDFHENGIPIVIKPTALGLGFPAHRVLSETLGP